MFWGVAVESGKKYSQIVETSYHLSMAALEPLNKKIPDSNKSVSLMLEHSKTEFLLCTLEYNRVMQVKLDLMFVEGEEVTFYLNGEGIVHLTGYVIDDDDEASASEGSETEEAAPVTRKNKIQFNSYANDKADSEDSDEESSSHKVVALKRKSEEIAASSAKKQKQHSKKGLNTSGKAFEPESKSLQKGKQTFAEAELYDSEDEEDEDFEIDDDIDDLKDESDSEDLEGDESDDDAVEEEEEEEDDDVEANGGWGKSWGDKSKSPQKNVSQVPKGKGNKSPQVVGKGQNQSPNDNKNQTPNLKKNQTPNGNKNQTPNANKNQTPVNKNQGGKGDNNQSLNKTPGSKKKHQPQQNKANSQSPGDVKPNVSITKPEVDSKKLSGGVQSVDIVEGKGPVAKPGKMCHVYYTGKLASNKKEFDSCLKGKPFPFKLGKGQVIKGWDLGVEGMKVGGKRKIVIPPAMAYGNKGQGPIPGNSTLEFEVELKAVN